MDNESLAEKSVERDGYESISGESTMDSVQGSERVSRLSSDDSGFGRSVWVTGEATNCVPMGIGKGESCLSSEDESLVKSRLTKLRLEMMKERFAKLLLGEDMSGGGKGVCSALTISNAITNLCATVFGQLWRLEPLPSGKKAMWQREMKWLLSVSDFIVEFVPSMQTFPDGGNLEVMACRPRSDLAINLPALCKLDNMLLEVLDEFANTEFWYVDQGIVATTPETDGSGKSTPREKEKWWLPLPRVPPDGLSQSTRKKLSQKRDSTSQILKAVSSINNSVLSEMEAPASYLENLPKTGRACLGEVIYKHFISESFSPEYLLDCLDLSSEHAALEIANRLEASIHLLRRRQHPESSSESQHNRSSSSSWVLVQDFVTNGVKSKVLAERAECLRHCLKQRFPNLSQTNLDISKIQCNKDVGKAILESYSRVLESLAFSIVARIDDVLYIDDISRKPEKVVFSITKANKKNLSLDPVPGSGTPTKSFNSKPPRHGFGVKKALTSYLSHYPKAIS